MEGEPKAASSRTRWACATCFTVYRERYFAARARPRDRLRLGVCSRCALRARTKLLELEHPLAAELAPQLERIGNRILGQAR